MSEAVKVEPIVNGLKQRVEELLLEWPDHPGLVQVIFLGIHTNSNGNTLYLCGLCLVSICLSAFCTTTTAGNIYFKA